MKKTNIYIFYIPNNVAATLRKQIIGDIRRNKTETQ